MSFLPFGNAVLPAGDKEPPPDISSFPGVFLLPVKTFQNTGPRVFPTTGIICKAIEKKDKK